MFISILNHSKSKTATCLATFSSVLSNRAAYAEPLRCVPAF